MRLLKWIRRIFTVFIGIISTVPVLAQAKEDKDEAVPFKDEQPAKTAFSKEGLIQSLRNMRRNPQEIKTICAMCYKVAVSPKEVEFQCDRCGQSTVYAAESEQGIITEKLPYIRRSLAELPYEISLDTTGFCPLCGKDKKKVLIMNVSCFNCGKKFSWEVKNKEDIDMFKWLYLKPPINEIDFSPWDNPKAGGKEKKIKQIAEYLYEHVFCPECRKKISID